jgi:hypothetical protein
MERESTGTKYMAANCGGSQSPPRAVELSKKKFKIETTGGRTFAIPPCIYLYATKVTYFTRHYRLLNKLVIFSLSPHKFARPPCCYY